MEWQRVRDEGMEEIMEVLEAYHKVARVRFVDGVCMVVQRKVLGGGIVKEVRKECMKMGGKWREGEGGEGEVEEGGIEEEYKKLVKARRILVEFVGRRGGR